MHEFFLRRDSAGIGALAGEHRVNCCLTANRASSKVTAFEWFLCPAARHCLNAFARQTAEAGQCRPFYRIFKATPGGPVQNLTFVRTSTSSETPQISRYSHNEFVVEKCPPVRLSQELCLAPALSLPAGMVYID